MQEKITLAVGFRWKRFLAVFLLIVYQIVGQIVLSSLVVRHAETMCIDRLREATVDYAQNFYEHAMSDREQLRVVADMLAVLMDEGDHDLHTHLASFEQRGMLDWLQVLLPDGTLITGSGSYTLSDQLSYQDEVARLPFISNISSGLVDPSKRVIRSAVPITRSNEIIAVLYGVYDLSAGREVDGTNIFGGQSYTFVLETDTGNYIMDGLRGKQATGSTGSRYEGKSGYDMDVLAADLAACREGYSAFRSRTIDDYMYIYYAPIGINNWMTMISVPESVAMAYAYESRDLMLGSMAYISLGVIVYFMALYGADQRLQNKNDFVNRTQARLMEVYHKPEYYHEALLDVAKRTGSNAVFLVDELLPQAESISGDDQTLIAAYRQQEASLSDELLSLCRQQRRSATLRLNSRVLLRHPLLARFLKENGQSSIALVPIMSAEGTIHQIIGAFSPANPDTLVLLNTVSVSFLMAASSMDYLTRLEIASTVDALTGAMNRTSYQLRLDKLAAAAPAGFACVYIDVNDLHAINNRYGHEKGDAMLRSIAAALKNVFSAANVYRFGGDEFVILIENVTSHWLENAVIQADAAIRADGYTVSIGSDWAEHVTDIDAMIRNAESRMYKAKYLFYQQKEKQAAVTHLEHKAVRRLLTENADVNAFLEVAEHHYRGVYFVNLDTDDVREVFARAYFYHALQVAGNKFSATFHQYMAETVDKQSRRNLQNFFDYQQIGEQVALGQRPTVEYTKADGERIRLTVHRSPLFAEDNRETLWVFEAV